MEIFYFQQNLTIFFEVMTKFHYFWPNCVILGTKNLYHFNFAKYFLLYSANLF
jgi:hypothetical protein